VPAFRLHDPLNALLTVATPTKGVSPEGSTEGFPGCSSCGLQSVLV
jgi:hypothetical protein